MIVEDWINDENDHKDNEGIDMRTPLVKSKLADLMSHMPHDLTMINETLEEDRFDLTN